MRMSDKDRFASRLLLKPQLDTTGFFSHNASFRAALCSVTYNRFRCSAVKLATFVFLICNFFSFTAGTRVTSERNTLISSRFFGVLIVILTDAGPKTPHMTVFTTSELQSMSEKQQHHLFWGECLQRPLYA